MKNIAVLTMIIIMIISFLETPCSCEALVDIINSNQSASETGQDSAYLSPSADKVKKYAVQIGIYLDQDQADKQIVALKANGLDPYIFQSINNKNQTVYTVRLGIFSSRAEAFEYLNSIQDTLSTPALVVAYDSLRPVESPETTAEHPEPTAHTAIEKERSVYSSEASIPTSFPVVPESLEERIRSMEAEILKLREESEVRNKLTITDDEAEEEEKDILEAAGKEYSLTTAGNIAFSYGFGYSYSEYDAIQEAARVEDVANHSISNSLSVSYGLKDNLTLGVSIPFVYKYNRVGTIYSQDVNDFGDLNLRWQLQPFRTDSDMPSIIVNGSFGVPVGRSPYEIQVGEELSTSSGVISSDLGVSVSQTTDPVVVFSSMSMNYSLPVTDIDQKRNEGILDEVHPGIGIGVGAGMAYALSYKLNINLSFSYSYSFETEYKYKNGPTAKSGTGAAASMRIGSGYRLSRTQNLNFTFGIPITTSGSFSFSFSTPIEFEL